VLNEKSIITFIIVTRNSRLFMASLLESILNQTRRDFQVAVIDNNSSDGTADFVRTNYPMVSVIENNKNLGFAKANNQAIKLFKTPFLVLCNPDIVLEKNWLETIMSQAENPELADFGVFGGKLLKLKMINLETGETEKTEKIDSCGLQIQKNHRAVERGAGQDASDYTDDQEVFGHSGALILIKREALDSIILLDRFHSAGDFFDGSFFFYKEDVDLAWRLRLAGIRSYFVASAEAYHLRTFSGSETDNWRELMTKRKRQNILARYYSYRNHLLILFEDLFIANWFYYAPYICWLELKKFFYVVFFETKNLLAWWEIIKMLPEIKAKRKRIFSQSVIKAGDLRKWIN